jgi:ATP-binding cassette subfamily F protein 2
MSSSWHIKQEKKRQEQALRDEEAERNAIDFEGKLSQDIRGAAMGKGDDELFEKKLSKEEKKALAKAKREAKKKAKGKGKANVGNEEKKGADLAKEVLKNAQAGLFAEKDLSEMNEAADKLASEGTICTFSTSKKGIDQRSRDINVTNFTLQHKGMVMLDGTEIVLNHGNRYGLLGRNGCGKSTLMKALGARAVPIPSGIDIFHLKEEIEPSDTISAIEAVMSVDEERERLEKEADNLNNALSALADDDDDEENEMSMEEQQEQIMDLLNYVYERLDALDASTAETRARSILNGLGFTPQMQEKKTCDFSGGWRMRVSLARALFIQPTLLLLDEPTNQ